MNTESKPENVIALGCFTFAELTAIGLGVIVGGPLGALVGAAVPPALVCAIRSHEETKRSMIKEMPSRQKLEAFIKGMSGESTGVYFDTREGKFKDK